MSTLTTSRVFIVTQSPADVGPCPPSRIGIPPNFTQPSDIVWANAVLADPNASAPNIARANQLLAGPRPAP